MQELEKVQVPQEELKQYVSLTSVQTKGLKRQFREDKLLTKEYKVNLDNQNQDDALEVSINAIKGSKKRRLAILEEQKVKDAVSDPNVIGFDVSYRYC